MELTPNIAKVQLVRYLWGEGILPHPDVESEENEIPPFPLAAIHFIVQGCNGVYPNSIYRLNQQIYKLTHLLGDISCRLNYLCILQQSEMVSDYLLKEIVSHSAKQCIFSDTEIITAIQTSITYWLRTSTKIQSVSYQFAVLLETVSKLSLAINDIDHQFPITKHSKQ